MGKYNSRETCNYETSFFLCRNQSPVNITKNVFDRKPIKQCKIYQTGNFSRLLQIYDINIYKEYLAYIIRNLTSMSMKLLIKEI